MLTRNQNNDNIILTPNGDYLRQEDIMDYKLLKRLAIFKCGSVGQFSSKINWNKDKTSRLINGKYIPTIIEADTIRISLGLTAKECLTIFLPNVSPNGDEI